MPTMLFKAAGSILGETWAAWNTWRKASRCSKEMWIRSQIEMSAFTFFSWVVMSTVGWSFLVVVEEEEVEGCTGFSTVGGWVGCFVGGVEVGSMLVSLVAGTAGLYTLPNHVISTHISVA